jgi:predicted ATPase
MKKKVVITGGPSTGKTTLINSLVANGNTCLPEISRDNGVAQLFLANPLLFSEKILEGRLAQYFEAEKIDENIVFLDRGLPDVLAYMNYIGDSLPAHFEQVSSNNRYDVVFILPPWEEIYTTDEARYETFEEATLIDKHLLETYQYFGYKPILVPKGSTDFRTNFILKTLNAV